MSIGWQLVVAVDTAFIVVLCFIADHVLRRLGRLDHRP